MMAASPKRSRMASTAEASLRGFSPPDSLNSEHWLGGGQQRSGGDADEAHWPCGPGLTQEIQRRPIERIRGVDGLRQLACTCEGVKIA